MSVTYGTSNVNSGLVFYYDQNNTQKSWKGAPVTNLIPYSQAYAGGNFMSNWTGNMFNNWINSTVTTGQLAPDGTYTADLLTGYYARYSQTISVAANTTYTFSCWVKNAGLVNPILLGIATGLSNTVVSAPAVTTSAAIASIGNWTRYSVSYTIPASGVNQIQCGIDFGASKSANPTGYSVYAWGAQCEARSFASPYVPSLGSSGTRSNTQSLVDLTNKNTITATSLTYDSDGAFSFDGSSNNIDATGLGFTSGMGQYTIMHWSRRDVESRMPIAYRGGSVFYHYGDNSWYYTHGGVAGEYYYPRAMSIPLGTWGHYCIVYDGSNVKIYRNAYFEGQQATTGTADWSNGMKIGMYTGQVGYHYQGKIGAVSFYNRALSAAEIQQNFNATRGKYGI
jgi:hypothetical protein